MQRFFEEVLRRKVLPVAVAYAIGGWLLLQIGDVLIGLLELPGWLGKVLVALVAIGLPIALILAWIYDWTPKGIIVTGDEAAAPARTFTFSEPEPIDVGEMQLVSPELGELIGRHAECNTLRECLQSAKDGIGGIVLIGGEPGVGKSRLGDEALAIGRDMGLLPLTGHAYEDRSVPFITSSEILEEATQVLPGEVLRNVLGGTAPEISKLLPNLRRVFPNIPEPTELPPEQQQRFLFNAVLEFLQRLGQCTPVVLMFDDIHWADDSNIALLEHLAPHMRKLPILMVGTFRDVESDMGEPFKRSLATMSREPYVTRIALHRFTRNDVLSLLTVLSGHDPPPNVVNAIFEETNGNAFFVQSVYQHLADEGRLFDDQGDWRTDIDTRTLDVPDSVRLVTGRRIAKLDQATQDMLNVAAVMGVRFRVPVLETAVDSDVLDGIEEAEAAQLLKRSTGKREIRYEFVHALARYTVLHGLSAPRQQKLHLQVADAIEKVRVRNLDEHAAEMAFHLVEAGSYADEENTVHWLRVAGENGMASAAFEEAREYFDTALEVLGDEQTEIRADLLHLHGGASRTLGDIEGFVADYSDAFSLYESLAYGEQAARIAATMGHHFAWSAQYEAGHALIDRALALVDSQDSPDHCRLLSTKCLIYSSSGDPVSAKRLYMAAEQSARQLGDALLLAEVLINKSYALWHALSARTHQPVHEAAAILRQLGREWQLADCLLIEKAGLVLAGNFEGASRIDAELMPIAKRHSAYTTLGLGYYYTAVCAQARGDLEGSIKALRDSRETYVAASLPWTHAVDGYQSANMLLIGNDQEGRKLVDRQGANLLPDHVWAGMDVGYWLLGKALLGDADVLSAFRSYQHYVPGPEDFLVGGRIVFIQAAAGALVLAGEKDEAAKLYPSLRRYFDWPDASCASLFFELQETAAGIAAAAANDWENAERHFEKTLRLAEELPHRVDQARVRYWYARMLLDRNASGHRDRAGQLLNEARSLSEEMGMHGLIGRIDELTT